MTGWQADGVAVTAATAPVVAWAAAAHQQAVRIAADPDQRAHHLRHDQSWFVGVDALQNAPDGSVDGVPLRGPWERYVAPPEHWHRAQVSIVYPGYPGRDPNESQAAHRFRLQRHAAHVDGLLPHGPQKRRFLGEWHSFILGLPLNVADAAPLMVWPGSHKIMGNALRTAIGDHPPTGVDLTEGYQAARRVVFDRIAPVPCRAVPGQAIILHRHLLHGVAPFEAHHTAPPEGRMIAYFRPLCAAGPQGWLAPDI